MASGTIGVLAVLGLLGLAVGSQSAVGDKTKGTEPKVKPYDQGLFDGANDCSSGKANLPDPAAAKASGDVDQYKAGYAKGYASCASTPAGKPSYACITPSAGMTLAQAQMALAARGYPITDELGVCGANTTSAIKTFQGDTGLVVDGLIGPATAAKLKAAADKGDKATEGTYSYVDKNGVKWKIWQAGVNLWRAQPYSPPTPDYNTHLEAPDSYALQAAIDSFAASVPSPSTAGLRARHARPHTPFARGTAPPSVFRGRRPAFPPYVRMM